MYYAMQFILTEFGYSVRAVRSKGYKSEGRAKAAILRSGNKGYVKKLGEKEPVWSNGNA